jgi:orotate phosphoribosyltransferase
MLEFKIPSTDLLKKELIDMIREKSYEKKEITLSSGLKSNFYVDMKQTMLHAKGIYLVSRLMLEKLKSFDGKIAGVGGMTMGADPMTSVVSLMSLTWKNPVHAFYIRKEPKGHGTNEWVEGLKNFSKGESVFILEDVVTTGGSSLKAVERAEMAGLKVLGILTCVDRQEGGLEKIEEKGLQFLTLVTKQEIACEDT